MYCLTLGPMVGQHGGRGGQKGEGPTVVHGGAFASAEKESACKPGSVENNHSSGTCVATGLKQPTRKARGPRVGSKLPAFPIWPCSGRGLPMPRPVARRAVRSYRTFSPLPALADIGGCFLWHFPSARAAQALPGVLPCGARTFLPRSELRQRLFGQLRRHCSRGRWPAGAIFCKRQADRQSSRLPASVSAR
jgi:hypothetical protein